MDQGIIASINNPIGEKFEMTTVATDEEIKEYHLKRLTELSIPEPAELYLHQDGSIWKNDQLLAEEPTEDQKRWVLFRLSHNNTWPKVHGNKIGDRKNWD